MSFKVTGLFDVEEMLLEFDLKTRHQTNQMMHDKAIELRDLARDMAPIDEGNLEEAIKVDPDEDIDVFGGRKIIYRVYIDMDMEAPHHNVNGDVTKGTENKTVGDYAYYVHEYVTPSGNNQLGELSAEKQESVDVEVGGGFMTRAAEQIEQTIIHDILFGATPAGRWESSRALGGHYTYRQPRVKGRFTQWKRR